MEGVVGHTGWASAHLQGSHGCLQLFSCCCATYSHTTYRCATHTCMHLPTCMLPTHVHMLHTCTHHTPCVCVCARHMCTQPHMHVTHTCTHCTHLSCVPRVCHTQHLPHMHAHIARVHVPHVHTSRACMFTPHVCAYHTLCAHHVHVYTPHVHAHLSRTHIYTHMASFPVNHHYQPVAVQAWGSGLSGPAQRARREKASVSCLIRKIRERKRRACRVHASAWAPLSTRSLLPSVPAAV